jgi:hypothetical protein
VRASWACEASTGNGGLDAGDGLALKTFQNRLGAGYCLEKDTRASFDPTRQLRIPPDESKRVRGDGVGVGGVADRRRGQRKCRGSRDGFKNPKISSALARIASRSMRGAKIDPARTSNRYWAGSKAVRKRGVVMVTPLWAISSLASDVDGTEVGAGLMDGFVVFCMVLCVVFTIDTLKINDQFST